MDDHWYPSDLRVRAKVDEYLSWHTGGIRCKCFYWAVSIHSLVPTLGCKYSFTGGWRVPTLGESAPIHVREIGES